MAVIKGSAAVAESRFGTCVSVFFLVLVQQRAVWSQTVCYRVSALRVVPDRVCRAFKAVPPKLGKKTYNYIKHTKGRTSPSTPSISRYLQVDMEIPPLGQPRLGPKTPP